MLDLAIKIIIIWCALAVFTLPFILAIFAAGARADRETQE